MNEKIKIEKGSVQETLIIPLYARKKCSDKFPKLYTDPMAGEICERIDYDFSSLDKLYEKTAYEFGAMEGALRQMDMMWEIKDYLKSHPKASIVCMGCGLDFDPRRCGGSDNKIFNVDFQDVIQAREELAPIDARLVFDTVGKTGYKLMMKAVLKNHGMTDFGELFYTGDAVKDLSDWSDAIRVSSKGYMLGYYDMKAPGVRGMHRLLARVGDNLMKMQIVRMEKK